MHRQQAENPTDSVEVVRRPTENAQARGSLGTIPHFSNNGGNNMQNVKIEVKGDITGSLRTRVKGQ